MLSRTAEGLFWLGRYVERAGNLARLLEAGRRFDQMSSGVDAPSNEWEAILIAAGCSNTFEGDVKKADAQDAIRHICTDDTNPSSIKACFAMARANARAQRVALTADVWDAANDGWSETRKFSDESLTPRHLSGTLDRVRQLAAQFRGSVDGTLLRDEGYAFVRLGMMMERADATARLLDVKYHVLLPSDRSVGGSFDELQWSHVLRAAGARSSYRMVYRKPVESKLVMDFLIRNAQCPRSLRYCYDRIHRHILELAEATGQGANSLSEVGSIHAELRDSKVDSIIAYGLHEYLTELIARTNRLAISIGSDYAFGPAATATQTQAQS